MRIALLSNFFPPEELYGVPRYTEDLARMFAAKEHDVEVITGTREDPRIESREGYRIHRVSSSVGRPRKLAFLGLLSASRRIYRRLLRLHREQPFDVVESPNTTIPGFWSVLRGVGSPAPRFVVRLSSPRTKCSRLGRFVRVTDFLEGAFVRRANGIIGNSRENLRTCAADYRWSESIPNCVILHGLPWGMEPAYEATAERSQNLLFLGRMEERKGFDVLARAWPKIARTFVGARLRVAGEDGPFRREPSFYRYALRDMPDYARERLEYLEYVDVETREMLYRSSELVVVPSRYESFGLTALEAMRYGVPVVSCNVGGIPEVIVDGKTGLLVPPDNPEKLADAIMALLGDPEKRERMGRAAVADLKDRFSLNRVAEESVRFYESLVVV